MGFDGEGAKMRCNSLDISGRNFCGICLFLRRGHVFISLSKCLMTQKIESPYYIRVKHMFNDRHESVIFTLMRL